MWYASVGALLVLLSTAPEQQTFDYAQVVSGRFLDVIKAPSLYDGEMMETATLIDGRVLLAKQPDSHRGTGGVPHYVFSKKEDRYAFQYGFLARSLYMSEGGDYVQVFGYYRLSPSAGSIHAIRVSMDGDEFAAGEMPVVVNEDGAVGSMLWNTIVENGTKISFTPAREECRGPEALPGGGR